MKNFMNTIKEIRLKFSTNSTLNINYFSLQKKEYIHKLKNVEIIKDNTIKNVLIVRMFKYNHK